MNKGGGEEIAECQRIKFGKIPDVSGIFSCIKELFSSVKEFFLNVRESLKVE